MRIQIEPNLIYVICMRINFVPFFCRIRVELARDRRDRDRDGGDRRGGGRDGGRGGGRYDDRGGKYCFAISITPCN